MRDVTELAYFLRDGLGRSGVEWRKEDPALRKLIGFAEGKIRVVVGDMMGSQEAEEAEGDKRHVE